MLKHATWVDIRFKEFLYLPPNKCRDLAEASLLLSVLSKQRTKNSKTCFPTVFIFY